MDYCSEAREEVRNTTRRQGNRIGRGRVRVAELIYVVTKSIACAIASVHLCSVFLYFTELALPPSGVSSSFIHTNISELLLSL